MPRRTPSQKKADKMRSFERQASSSSSSSAERGIPVGLAARFGQSAAGTAAASGSFSSSVEGGDGGEHHNNLAILTESLSTDLMNDTEIPLVRSPRYTTAAPTADDVEATTGWTRTRVRSLPSLLHTDAVHPSSVGQSVHESNQ